MNERDWTRGLSHAAYITINGINMFLCLLRFLKYCDFQPRMGVVTRTLTRAFQDLAHFFALVFIVMAVYTFLGQIVFGSKVKQFSSLAQAWSSHVTVPFTVHHTPRVRNQRQQQAFTPPYLQSLPANG